VTVAQAATELGTTPEAIRGRIKRGTLRAERESGRVFVLLDADQSRPTAGQPTDQPTDQADHAGHAYRQAEGQRLPVDPLTEELRDRVRSLERQLEQANERDRENRRIIAALTSRIPAIEAPPEAVSEPSEAPTEATEQPGRVEPQTPLEGTQETTERPWWRRVFGG
jgi:hypothetical protein